MARIVLLTAMLSLLAACGGKTAEREVRLLAPAGYVEDGSTDPAADWVTAFERDTGCVVDLRVVDDGEDVVAIGRRRDADAIATGRDGIARLRKADEVGSVELDRVPAYRNLHPTLRRLTPEAVPHAWGRLAIVGRTERSWDAVLQAADAAAVIDSPLILELFDRDPLRSFFARGGTLWSDEVTAALSLRRGDAELGVGPERIAARAPGAPAAVPREGTVGWVTAWVIRRAGDNLDCAHRWIAHATSVDVNRRSAIFAGVRPAHCASACAPLARVGFPVVSAAQRQRWAELTEQVARRER